MRSRKYKPKSEIQNALSRYLRSIVMRFASTIFFLLLLKFCFSQSNYSLLVVSSDKPKEFFTKKFSYKNHFKDSLQANTEAKDLFNKIRSFGYLASSIDSMTSDSTQTVIYIYVGDKFENIVLQNGNVDPSLLASAGVKNSVLNGKKIPIGDAEVVKAKIIQQCENTGYPFASVRLDSFTAFQNSYTAKIYLQKNELIVYDSLQILGKTKTKKMFLRNYLGIKVGKPYNESNVRKIQQRINELQFAESIQPRTVAFQNGKAKVNLYLKDKKSSQFDFLLGFLPGSSGQKLLITGEARIHLFSLFGCGRGVLSTMEKAAT
jgi:translocation and assembly module TamA